MSILRRNQWGGCAGGIQMVASFNIGENILKNDVASSCDVLVETAACADFCACCQEQLQRRVGEHHRSDVASLNDAAVGAVCEVALKLNEVVAHFGNCRNGGHMSGDFRPTDLVLDVFPTEQYFGRTRVVVDAQRQVFSRFNYCLDVRGVDPRSQHVEGGDAVHGAGIEVVGIECFSYGAAGA